MFNQSTTLLNQSSSINRPRIRSAVAASIQNNNANNELNAKPRSSPAIEIEKRQNTSPGLDDRFNGILQMLLGNFQLNRSPSSSNSPQPTIINNQIIPPNLLNNPNLKQYLMNQQLPVNRVNSRLPSSLPNALPNGFIVGPSNRPPPSLPLHFHKQQINRPLNNNNNLNAQQQFNNQLLHQLLKQQGVPLNLTSLPINNILSNIIANNQSLDQILPNGVLNTSISSKNYVKVEQAEVSRLLGLNKPMRNEIAFSSTSLLSSPPFNSINNDDSIHFPNELFARASINRTLSENNAIMNTNNLNNVLKANPTKPIDQIQTSKLIDKIDNLFELSNATVLNNNHIDVRNRFPFNKLQLASSFSSITTQSIDATAQLNTNQILASAENNSNNLQQLNSITSTIWQPFEMFNTNNNLVKPTRTYEGGAPDIITKPEEASTFDITVRNSKMGANESKNYLSTIKNENKENSKSNVIKNTPPSTQAAGLHESAASKEPEVVYGRRQPINHQDPQLRPGSVNSVNPSTTQAIITSVTLDHNSNNINNQKPTPSLPQSTINESIGRPLVYPVEMDLVKPQIATNQISSVSIITESDGGSVYIDAQQKHFKLKPGSGQKPNSNNNNIPSLQIGSAMNVYGNTNGDNSNYNLAGRTKPGSSLSNLNPINPFNSLSSSSNNNQTNDKSLLNRNQIRRPTFRPKPATPLVRIDTCVVGDDSTCGANLNEQCKIEGGISSCQCKPGKKNLFIFLLLVVLSKNRNLKINLSCLLLRIW